jgi:hypothetical protein
MRPALGRRGAGDRLQEGGLAGPVRADEGDDLAALDGQRGSDHRVQQTVADVEVTDVEQAHATAPPK